VELNPEKVALINSGRAPFVEPGLTELLEGVVASGLLRATTSAADAVAESDMALICVGTPSRPNGQMDLRALERVARDIGAALRGRTRPFAVVCRSTVVPGTTERIVVPALRSATDAPGLTLRIAVNPEFMREGSALRDFTHPAFTVVGCTDAETANLVRALYADVEAPFVRTEIRTAELLKYASNAFHAVKVCFANEIGDVCDAFGIDSQELMQIFLMDRKLNVSEAYLRPGFAFGGSCLPKDLRGLLYAARAADVTLPLLSAALPSNDGRIRRGAEAVLETGRRRIGVVGLAFKTGTDDLRESPIVTLVETLIGKGCDVRILDGDVALARLMGANRSYIEEQIPHIASLMCNSVEALLRHAEVLVIGNPSKDAALALAGVGPDQVVVDLTRGGVLPQPVRSGVVLRATDGSRGWSEHAAQAE
jgi:GDP-mannose 6-dehydrogenase